MSSVPRHLPAARRVERRAVWAGDVSWRDLSQRREALFDDLEASDSSGVRLDVRSVTSIDRPGVALLIGANYRAGATGRRLTIIDDGGPVTRALARMNLLGSFHVGQVPATTCAGAGRPPQASSPR